MRRLHPIVPLEVTVALPIEEDTTVDGVGTEGFALVSAELGAVDLTTGRIVNLPTTVGMVTSIIPHELPVHHPCTTRSPTTHSPSND